MFNKGYSASGGDDILGGMVRTSPQNAFSKKITFNPSNLADEEDPFLLPRSNFAKSMTNPPAQTFNTSSSLSRRKPDDNKKIADDVDDLLTLIEGGGKSDVSKKPPLPKAGGSPSRLDAAGSTGNRFYDEFNDDNNDGDVVSSLYVPAARDHRSKPSYGSNEDITKKRSNLFGLPADQSVNQSLKTTESIDQGYGTNLKLQRPQTSDPKATMQDSGIGEITLAVSRRGGKTKAQAKDPNRPFTSPGILEKPDQFSEDRSMGAETPNMRRTGGLNRGYYEEEDDGVSDFMTRDRADSKKSLLTAGTGFNAGLESEPGTRWDVGGGRRDRLRADHGMEATPKKSPGSEYGGRRGGGGDQDYLNSQTNFDDHRDYGAGNRGGNLLKRDYYDTASQLMSHASQPNSMNNFGQATGLGTTGGRRRGETRGDPAIRVEDDIAQLVRAQTGTSGIGGGSQNMLGTPMRDASIMIQEGAGIGGREYVMHDTAAANKNFVRETEEFYKKRMKEAEEYYEKRFEDLKKALEEEKKKWEGNYVKEIEQLKKEKEELRESSRVQVDRERDRLKEIFNLELESKDKVHKYEMERQKHLLEEQNEGLKRQLEAQSRLNALADEVRTSSNKLITLTDRLDKDNNKEGTGKRNELADRERRVEELEMRLKHEQTMWESEKKRLEKLRTELDDREGEIQKMLERERELLRGEYQRLTELQDSIKDQETDKRRKFENEKKAWENERVRLEEENKKLKVDFRDKYEQMETQVEVFETQKHEFEEMIEKSEVALRQKHDEVDSTRKRLTIQEADILRRFKALEHKEMISRKDHEELESKLNLLEIERLSLERERMEMRGVAQKSREDVEVLSKFKREWEVEKERNTKMKLEMDMLSRTIQQEREKMTQEKSTISNLHKTLEGIRFNYVKEFAATGPQPYISSSKIAADNLLAFGGGKENSGMENYRQTASNTMNYAKERSRSPLRENNRKQEPMKILTSLKDLKNKDNYVRTEEPAVMDNSKLTTAKGFNYKTYMDQLKQYDKKTSFNQTYIDMEKEGLMKNKVDYGSGSLMRIKSLATSESSFKSSPKFKNSLAQYNTYDKMDDL